MEVMGEQQQKVKTIQADAKQEYHDNRLYIVGSGSEAVYHVVRSILAVAEQLAILNDRIQKETEGRGKGYR